MFSSHWLFIMGCVYRVFHLTRTVYLISSCPLFHKLYFRRSTSCICHLGCCTSLLPLLLIYNYWVYYDGLILEIEYCVEYCNWVLCCIIFIMILEIEYCTISYWKLGIVLYHIIGCNVVIYHHPMSFAGHTKWWIGARGLLLLRKNTMRPEQKKRREWLLMVFDVLKLT